MSRALDKDVIESLGSELHSSAYDVISKALIEQPGGREERLLEIEILGKAHPLAPGQFLLQDGNDLAISKLGLVQAFFTARVMLQERKGNPDMVLAATSVMLLMDPEHLTAANTRKRAALAKGNDDLLDFICQDKTFVDSLLTSRLHRHTKSPTLWSHRRWLIETRVHHGVQPDVVGDLKRVVMISGQRHPRNYYAWSHARWLTGLIPKDQQDNVLRVLVDATKEWCFRNHTDISGWSFLSFLLTRLADTSRSSVVLEDTLKLVTSFSWANESTWVFLRTLAVSGTVEDDTISLFQETRKALLPKINASGGRQVVDEAVSR